jgi:sporulation protein YlmC with PRC-barrel domain
MKQDYLDICRQVLDHEVVDSNNIPCGMVDDVELEGGPGGELKVTAILIGPGVWAERLPALTRFLVVKVFGRHKTRVPWEQVSVITERVKLQCRAAELGLGKLDRKASRWLKRIPGAG